MPDSALGNFGAARFGWDPQVGRRAPFLKIERIHTDHATVIKAPRKYGLHATLKSPFRLKTQFTETELILNFQEFCAQAAPARSRKLIPKIIGGFGALAPTTSLEAFNRLARDCVRFFLSAIAPL